MTQAAHLALPHPHPQRTPRSCQHAAPRPSAAYFLRAQIAIGAFLLTTKTTGNTGLGLSAMAAVLMLNVVLTALKPDTGVAKPGLAVWAVLQAVIGTLAYLNEK